MDQQDTFRGPDGYVFRCLKMGSSSLPRLSYSRLEGEFKHLNNLRKFPEMNDYARPLKEVTNAKIQKELVVLEDQEGSVNCKIGVIYALGDQITDAQMLSNGWWQFLLWEGDVLVYFW